MSQRRRPADGQHRSYRSARRREQEVGKYPADDHQAAHLGTPRSPQTGAQQPATPLPKDSADASASRLSRRNSAIIKHRQSSRRAPRWVKPLLFSVLPFVVLAVGLVSLHFILLANEPDPAPAISEQEAYEHNNFPLYYRELIEQNADHYNIPASLIAAMVLSESSFEAGVENSIQARGLMQLMPKTAQWVSEKLDEEAGYSFDMMLTAEANLRYGSWYLQYLLNRFDGNMVNAVCGFHAGQGNVDSWLANAEYSRDGKTLLVIPTDDTAAYAKRVLNAQQVYQRRYFEAREGEPTGINLPQMP